ncbi:MAG: N-6 DNA methylase, partial [Acidobacteria bacterium]|nr:N-6 DNA methylase [Acidobacteriota bacterium]
MDTTAQLQDYGISPSSVRMLGDSVTPALIEYLDLVEPRREHPLLPDGVVESLGRPLLFFVNESRLALPPDDQEAQLGSLRRALACRGERAYLARVLPGELKVVPVSLDEKTPEWKVYRAGTGEALTFFSRLALGEYDGKGQPETADFVFERMFNLLRQSADNLAQSLNKSDVLSLVGRALFFRFLCDRRIVREQNTTAIAPKAGDLFSCFDTPENAAATCRWLDDTFNGDFLPLTNNGNLAFFEDARVRTDGAVFLQLGAIVRGARHVGAYGYQVPFWAEFDFAHIPVGLLSQVYEAFSRKWDETSRETSVHYTPRNIAATLVNEAFDGLPDAHRARVLDAACGAGMFLVLAFRRLYRERWERTGVRPDTKAIRKILEGQLVGFDISDYALRLSALSLYLTAIELDPRPVPPEALIFNNLKNHVLFNHRREGVDAREGPVIGSLGTHVREGFDNQFDLVIGNPPWTSLDERYKVLAAEFTTVSRAVIKSKGEATRANFYQNPDNAPDLPFLWKATEWCKPGGRIAMALPARILLKQEEVPRYARETMFRLIEITGIINGSNLADTRVWPRMNQPFLLLFARNRRPKAGHVLRLITPRYEYVLNRRGEVRIDSKSAQAVEVESTFEEAWLWKALAVGTPLDIEVIRKYGSEVTRPLLEYWESDLRLVAGNGYQIGGEQAKRDQQDASFLHGLPDLNSTKKFDFQVRPDELDTFNRLTLLYPRKREIYRAPLVLVTETPGEHREKGRALLAFSDVAYNESFHGYSAAGLENREVSGELAVRYLHLFVHSNIWTHYTLMVSSQFGAERRKFQKSDLDKCPIIPVENLVPAQRRAVMSLSKRLVKKDPTVFREIDAFFGDLYGLDELDLEVIEDTLRVELPFHDARLRAYRHPTPAEREAFRNRLECVIHPFFNVLEKEPHVAVWEPTNNLLRQKAPFGILLIGEKGKPVAGPDTLFNDVILGLAEETGATLIIQLVDGGVLVGILNQYRYWTPSRARLLGAEIVGQNMG